MIEMGNIHFSPLKHLNCLNQIFPVKGAIVVGAGLGEAIWFDLLQQIETNVLLIEADFEKIQCLEQKFSQNTDWDIQHQILADHKGKSTFYTFANSSESCLLAPEILLNLWPNIKLSSQHDCQIGKLDGLYLKTDFNWLILDCLPTLPILQGAETVLNSMDVLIMRVITDDQICTGKHASLEDIKKFMQKKGFQYIGLEQEIHPALGHGLFLRDYAGLFQQQIKQTAVKTTKLDKLEQESHTFQQQIVEQQEQLKRMHTQHDSICKQLDDCQEKFKQQTKELEQQKTLIEEQKQIIQDMTQKNEAQTKKLQHVQQQLGEQKKQYEEQNALTQKHQEQLERKTKELNTKSIESEGCKKKIQNLSQERNKLVSQIKNQNKEISELKENASSPNPYRHNRILTKELNISLKQFAHKTLNMTGIKPAYIDYLATKAIHIEKNCVGRLATTVEDAVARQLILECVPNQKICILEIGALYGVNLSILYNHMVTRSKKVKVVCLDPFDGFYSKATDPVLNNPVNKSTFVRNMQISNVPKNDYQIIKQYSTSPKAIETVKQNTINCIIIDGDHSYDGVKFDFENYFPLLEVGGYVIFDDYNAKEWPGVQKFIDEDLLTYSDFNFLGAISRTAVGRKKINKDS